MNFFKGITKLSILLSNFILWTSISFVANASEFNPKISPWMHAISIIDGQKILCLKELTKIPKSFSRPPHVADRKPISPKERLSLYKTHSDDARNELANALSLSDSEVLDYLTHINWSYSIDYYPHHSLDGYVVKSHGIAGRTSINYNDLYTRASLFLQMEDKSTHGFKPFVNMSISFKRSLNGQADIIALKRELFLTFCHIRKHFQSEMCGHPYFVVNAVKSKGNNVVLTVEFRKLPADKSVIDMFKIITDTFGLTDPFGQLVNSLQRTSLAK
ncbi:MAG: hypothetical protein KDD40_07795 [Bdellovibrionales bacterium]|nr:hypothetical protein [Bdellovibrionales bacterium]